MAFADVSTDTDGSARSWKIGPVNTTNGSTAYVGNFVFGDPGTEARAIQDWLAQKDVREQESRLNATRHEYVKGTGEVVLEKLRSSWLVKHDTQPLWLRYVSTGTSALIMFEADYNQIYSGDVGCGKSVICSLILDRLPSILRPSTSSTNEVDVIAPILFSFKAPASQKIDFVLRALLLRLCGRKRIPNEVKTLFKDNEFTFQAGQFELALFQVLKRLAQEAGDLRSQASDESPQNHIRSFTVVVDALDELSLETQDEMLRLLRRLHEIDSITDAFRVRIVLCSRPDSHIGRFRLNWFILNIDPTDTNSDIWTFFANRIDNHAFMSPREGIEGDQVRKKEILKQLTGICSGMFRLASLYWDNIKQWKSNLSDIPGDWLETLLDTQNLPRTLFDFYDRILERIEPADFRADMFVMIRWLLMAAQRMSGRELADACATLKHPDQAFDQSRRQLYLSAIQIHLSGLITVDVDTPSPLAIDDRTTNQLESRKFELPAVSSVSTEFSEPIAMDLLPIEVVGNRKLSFAHFSVQEWFMDLLTKESALCSNNHPSDDLRMDHRDIRYTRDKAQLYAARCCLAYLERVAAEPSGHYPLRSYAWHHWATHATASLNRRSPGLLTYGDVTKSYTTQQTMSSLRLFNEICCPEIYDHGKWKIFSMARRALTHSMANNFDHLLRVLSGLASRIEFQERYSTIMRDDTFPVGKQALEEAMAWITNAERYKMTAQQEGPDNTLSGRNIETTTALQHLEIPEHLSNVFTPLPTSGQTTRFIVLRPARDKNAVLECSTCTDALENRPRYTALSYKWDRSGTQPEFILVNGRIQSIRPNLAQALRELRTESEARVVWVDALCVRMQDLAERGWQVRTMDHIYQTAEEVVVWLGTGTPESNHVMDHLSNTSLDIWSGIDPESRAKRDQCTSMLFHNRLWRGIWVLMEVILANRVSILWGDRQILLSHVHGMTTLDSTLDMTLDGTLEGREESADCTFPAYRSLRQSHQLGNFLSLPRLLYQTRHFICTEPKDKVLTMLHLLSPSERQRVLDWVDYTISAQQLSIAVAEYCLHELKNLDILSINNIKERSGKFPLVEIDGTQYYTCDVPDLPSWVPAWHCLHWKRTLAPGRFDRERRVTYNAGGSMAGPQFKKTGQSLVVHGVEIDAAAGFMPLRDVMSTEFVVEAVRRRFEVDVFQERDTAPVLRLLTQSERNLQVANRQFSIRYQSKEERQAALWQTFLAGDDDGQVILDTLIEHPEDADISALFAEARRAFDVHDQQRHLCLTQMGRLALVPSWTAAGDVIVIFAGAAVPHVLRGHTPGKYRLVGECYVHGLMNGETTCDDTRTFELV